MLTFVSLEDDENLPTILLIILQDALYLTSSLSEVPNSTKNAHTSCKAYRLTQSGHFLWVQRKPHEAAVMENTIMWKWGRTLEGALAARSPGVSVASPQIRLCLCVWKALRNPFLLSSIFQKQASLESCPSVFPLGYIRKNNEKLVTSDLHHLILKWVLTLKAPSQ